MNKLFLLLLSCIVAQGSTNAMENKETAPFIPDGSYIVTASADGTPRIWVMERATDITGMTGPTGITEPMKYFDIVNMIIRRPLHVLAIALHLRLGEDSGASLLAEDGQHIILQNVFSYLTGKKE